MEMVGMRECPVPAWHGTATPCSATNCFHFLDAQTQHLHLHSVTFLYARKDQLETPRSPLSSQKCCLTKILIVFGHPCRTAAAPLFTVIIRSFNTNITAYCYGDVNTPFAKLAPSCPVKCPSRLPCYGSHSCRRAQFSPGPRVQSGVRGEVGGQRDLTRGCITPLMSQLHDKPTNEPIR